MPINSFRDNNLRIVKTANSHIFILSTKFKNYLKNNHLPNF